MAALSFSRRSFFRIFRHNCAVEINNYSSTSIASITEHESAPDKKQEEIQRPRLKVPLQYPAQYRLMFPEFLPMADMSMRHHIREIIERADMLRRRAALHIPEFYVGSIMAVTVSDLNAPNKQSRFLGICIQRGGDGLRAYFILRNVIDHIGVEIMYEMYNPTIQKIEVVRLEKRLDDDLLYLRDALPEYSTFSFDLETEYLRPGSSVPVNDLKVQLKPRPWHERWERKDLKGVLDLGLPEKFYIRAKELETPWEKYDLMKKYRNEVPLEDQAVIFEEVHKQEIVLEKIRNPKKNIGKKK